MRILKILSALMIFGYLIPFEKITAAQVPLAPANPPAQPVTLISEVFSGNEMRDLKQFCSQHLSSRGIKEQLTKKLSDYPYQHPWKFGLGAGASLFLAGWNAERLIPAASYLIPKLVDLGMGIWRFAMYEKIFEDTPSVPQLENASQNFQTPVAANITFSDALKRDAGAISKTFFRSSDQRKYRLSLRKFSLKGMVYTIGFLSVMYAIWYYLKIKPFNDFKIEIKKLENVIKEYEGKVKGAKSFTEYFTAYNFFNLPAHDVTTKLTELMTCLVGYKEKLEQINKNLKALFTPFEGQNLVGNRLANLLQDADNRSTAALNKVKREIGFIKSYLAIQRVPAGYRYQ